MTDLTFLTNLSAKLSTKTQAFQVGDIVADCYQTPGLVTCVEFDPEVGDYTYHVIQTQDQLTFGETQYFGANEITLLCKKAA